MKVTSPTFVALFQAVFCALSVGKMAAAKSLVRGVTRKRESRFLKKELKAPEKRDCKIKTKADRVESKCKTKEDSDDSFIKDEIKFKVETSSEGFMVKVEYEQEIETNETETETESQFEVYFSRIIEYAKNASDPDAQSAYDWELDEIVQTVALDMWEDIALVSEDETESVFAVSNPAGTVTFFFTISRAAQGELITANTIKIDFELSDFPWMREDTFVSLISTVETKRKVEVEYEADGGKKKDSDGTAAQKAKDIVISFADVLETNMEALSPLGVFTWVETADILGDETNSTVDLGDDDNSTVATTLSLDTNNTIGANETNSTTQVVVDTVSVVATSPEEEATEGGDDGDNGANPTSSRILKKDEEEFESKTIQSIAFSFVGEAAQNASNIYWDPSTGIEYADVAAGASSASNPGAAIACSVMAAVTALLLVAVM